MLIDGGHKNVVTTRNRRVVGTSSEDSTLVDLLPISNVVDRDHYQGWAVRLGQLMLKEGGCELQNEGAAAAGKYIS